MVGIPPNSRLRMMNFARNPTEVADFGGCFENLGAKSGTMEETTTGQKGDDVLFGFQLRGLKGKKVDISLGTKD